MNVFGILLLTRPAYMYAGVLFLRPQNILVINPDSLDLLFRMNFELFVADNKNKRFISISKSIRNPILQGQYRNFLI